MYSFPCHEKARDANSFNKVGWTGVGWISEKLNIKEHGLCLKQSAKEFNIDLKNILNLNCGSESTSNLDSVEDRPMPGPSAERSHSENNKEYPRSGELSGSKEHVTLCEEVSLNKCNDGPRPENWNRKSSSSDSRAIDEPRGSVCRTKQRFAQKLKHKSMVSSARHRHSSKNIRSRPRTPTVIESNSVEQCCSNKQLDEAIIKLGLNELMDFGMGLGSCYDMSTLLGATPGQDMDFRLLNTPKVESNSIMNPNQEMENISLKEKWTVLPVDSDLQTIKFRKQALDVEKDSKSYHRLKYKATTVQAFKPFDPTRVADLIPNETVVVVVRVYWPFTRMFHKRNLHEMKFSEEIVILGTQTLDMLRDQIKCVNDTVVPGECSENPCQVPDHTAKDVYKSGFFFIENTFYNDFRHPDNIDYSKVIRMWANERNMVATSAAAMESTRMEDLALRLGYPYLYQHQGDCEHLLTVSDVRLLHPSESRALSDYPHQLHRSRPRMQYCYMCGRFAACWLTKDNPRVPFSPCYFCDTCFHSFNYIDGKKVGTFKAYFFREPIFTP